MFAREKNVEKVAHRDITTDPREKEDWFLRMSAEARDEMRARWRAERVRFVPWLERQKAWRNRCMLEGLFVCALPASFLAVIATVGPLVVSVPAGLGTGWLWWRLNSGRLTSGGISMGAVLFCMVAGGLWSKLGPAPGFFFTVLAVFPSAAEPQPTREAGSRTEAANVSNGSAAVVRHKA